MQCLSTACGLTRKKTLKLHTVPDLPWSLVATNVFEWMTHHYLVLVDSYSGWFEIDRPYYCHH